MAQDTDKKPTMTAEQLRQLLTARVQGITRKKHRASEILSDISNKLTQAGNLIAHAPTSADDAFEQTADMLLEQAQKQLEALNIGIQTVRDEIAVLRIIQPAPEPTEKKP